MQKLLFLLFTFTITYVSAQQTHVHEVKDRAVFDKLKGVPLNNKFGQVEALKLVYDCRRKIIYYVDSKTYRYHRTFCDRILNYRHGHTTFNDRNYHSTDYREYYLATINYFKGQDRYIMEFSVLDEILPEQVDELYAKILETFSLAEDGELQLLLNTSKIEKRIEGNVKIKTIRPDELYAGQLYQPLYKKATYGYLKKVPIDSVETVQLQSTDIVIINGTPDDLPPISGVITTAFQTPLSHINVLCQNRGTPIAAYKNAWEDERCAKFLGKLVKYEVKAEDFTLELASEAEAKAYWAANDQKRKQTIQLRLDTTTQGLLLLGDLGFDKIKKVGGKAANFGELYKALSQHGATARVPEGAFAIPFYYYNQHLNENGLKSKIQAILANRDSLEGDSEQLRLALKDLRDAIKKAPINKDFLRMVEGHLKKHSPNPRMRFRSSTNAEDLDGFNGAGLYSSKTGILGDSSKTVEKAIKKVWASAWNYKAYMERSYFGINHNSVAMGILVHRSFPDETANGVAITKHLYRPKNAGFVINVQKGETSVVEPPEGVECDQMICYSDTEKGSYVDRDLVEYITYSSLNDGKSIMTTAEVVRLTKQLSKIKRHFYMNVNKNYRKYKYKEFALDIEFKVYGKDRRIYIKQVRPFKG